jgi:hypothetical protein
MKAQHTSGPWRIEINDTGFRITHSASGLRSHIATLHEAALCEEHGDTFANANIIASAPELLSALRGAVAYAEMEGGFHTPPCWYTDAKCLLEKLGGEA